MESTKLDFVDKRVIVIQFLGSVTADEKLFAFYWEKVHRADDAIILAHIIKPKDTKGLEWKDVQKKLLGIITPFIEECKRRGLHYQSIFHSGKSGEALCELVFEHTPDLVMMGSVTQSKLAKTMNSSTSDFILEKAATPVLIIPCSM